MNAVGPTAACAGRGDHAEAGRFLVPVSVDLSGERDQGCGPGVRTGLYGTEPPASVNARVRPAASTANERHDDHETKWTTCFRIAADETDMTTSRGWAGAELRDG